MALEQYYETLYGVDVTLDHIFFPCRLRELALLVSTPMATLQPIEEPFKDPLPYRTGDYKHRWFRANMKTPDQGLKPIEIHFRDFDPITDMLHGAIHPGHQCHRAYRVENTEDYAQIRDGVIADGIAIFEPTIARQAKDGVVARFYFSTSDGQTIEILINPEKVNR